LSKAFASWQPESRERKGNRERVRERRGEREESKRRGEGSRRKRRGGERREGAGSQYCLHFQPPMT
jgi:hypothetical protein